MTSEMTTAATQEAVSTPDQGQENTQESQVESTALENTGSEAGSAEQTTQATSPPTPKPTEDTTPKWFRERFDEITRQKYEVQKQSQAEIEHWQRIAYEADRERQRLAAEREEQSIGQAPTLEQVGGDVEKWIQSTTEWNAKKVALDLRKQQAEMFQRMQGHTAQQQQEAMRQAQAVARQAQEEAFLSQKMQEGAKLYPDFIEKISNKNLPPLRQLQPQAFAAMMNSPKGFDIAYQLASDPMLATQLATAHPAQALKMIGYLEGTLSAGNKVTSAPAPVKTVGSGHSNEKTAETMSMDEFVAWRNKNKRKSQ
jgi:type II secretory pathway pseudopilin PulG